MPVQRFTGPAFASVHGPADERKLALWTLDNGFAGMVMGATPRAIDWRALRDAVSDLPFDIPAAVAGARRAARPLEADLGSARGAERACARASLVDTARRAAGLGARILVFEPGHVPLSGGDEVMFDDLAEPGAAARGMTREAVAALAGRARSDRDAALDRVCREIHSLAQETDGVTLALAPSAWITGLGEPEALAAIFEDLGGLGRRLRYWHRPAIAAIRKQWLGEDQGLWLEQFADRMVGTDLSDGSDRQLGLLPGAGLVDYGMVASYTPRGRPVPGVLDLDPAVEPAEVVGARSFLTKFGL